MEEQNNTEQELEIQVTEKNGNVYKNLVLKPSKKQREQGITGLKPTNYVVVEKIFKEGYRLENSYQGKTLVSYSCKAKYKDEEVSFFLGETQHSIYSVLGDAGANVKITCVLKENSKTGAFYTDFKFDLISM